MSVDSKPGVIGSVLNWLRKGYPEGVPTTDYFPLLALLRKRLTDAELDEIVENLSASGHLRADRTLVATAIEQVSQQEPTDDDLALVASRLAAAGWPLAGDLGPRRPTAEGTDHVLERPAFLKAVLGWLREGYPEGVPQQDYIPLLALLRRRLSDEETAWVAGEIVANGELPAGPADIGVLITKITNEMPSEADVDRVREHLQDAGWPVVPAEHSD